MTGSSVTITYERPGTTPPIFVAGSFTSPTWTPIELDTQQHDGEFTFSKKFDISPGKYQYKFRIGHGDWWVCDDGHHTEQDASGNTNNVLTVEPPEAVVAIEKPAKANWESVNDTPAKDSSHSIDASHAAVAEQEKRTRTEKSLESSNDTTVGLKSKQTDQKSIQRPNANGSLSTSQPAVAEVVVPEKATKNQSDNLSKPQAELNDDSPRERTEGSRPTQDGLSKQLNSVRSASESISSIFGGKHLRLAAVALTALIVPILAWAWRT